MALYPGAVWRGPIPTSNYAKGRSVPVRGVTIHHMDTILATCDALFRQPGYQRSAHFGTGRDGTVYQWVDTDDVAYHACYANWSGYLGIENDDNANDDPLTDAQITAIRGIIDWLGIPKVLMVNMTDPGIGYHGQFPGDCSTHWGQTACPGSMVAQLPLLIAPAPTPVPTKESPDVKMVLYNNTWLQFNVDTAGDLIQSTYDANLVLVAQDQVVLGGNRPSSDVTVDVLADQRILVGTEDPNGKNRAINYRPGLGWYDASGNHL
jgi:hypothetical protein